MFKTKEEILTTILKTLPYSEQISGLDFSSEEDAIRFVWRENNKLRVTLSGDVNEIGDGVLIGNDISILVRQLIKNQWVSTLFV
jgi:hypothetical protein